MSTGSAATAIPAESFCERCGTRFSFGTPAKPVRLGGLRNLSRGLKNYVLNDGTSLSDTLARARVEDERRQKMREFDAFQHAFTFCMGCRQYTCGACWNEVAGRCQTCDPLPAPPVAPPAPAAARTGPWSLQPPAPLGVAAEDPFWIEPSRPAVQATEPPLEPEAEPQLLDADPAPTFFFAQLGPGAAIEADLPVMAAETADHPDSLFAAEAALDSPIAGEAAAPVDGELAIEGPTTEPIAVDAEALNERPFAAVEAMTGPLAAEAVVETQSSAEPEHEAESAPEPALQAVLPLEDAPVPEMVAETSAAVEETTAADAADVAQAPFAARDPLPDDALLVAELPVETPVTAEALAIDAPSDPGTAPSSETTSVEEDLDFLNLRARLDAWAPPSPAARPHVAPPAPHLSGPTPLTRRMLAGSSNVPAERPAAELATRPAAQPDAIEPAPRGAVPAPRRAEPAPPVVEPAQPAAEPAAKWWIVAPEIGSDRPADQIAQPTWSRPAATPAPQVPLRQVAQRPVTPPVVDRGESRAWPGVRENAAARSRGQDLPLVPPSESVWAASSRDVLNVPGSGVQACASCGLALSAAARFCRRCGTPQGAAHR